MWAKPNLWLRCRALTVMPAANIAPNHPFPHPLQVILSSLKNRCAHG